MILGPPNFYDDGIRPAQLRYPHARPKATPAPEPEPEPTTPPQPARDPDILKSWKDKHKAPPLIFIMLAVCVVTGFRPEHLRSRRRQVPLVTARFIFYYLARDLTTHSYPAIGRFCGGRDHSTVMHGLTKARSYMACAPVIAEAKQLLGVE